MRETSSLVSIALGNSWYVSFITSRRYPAGSAQQKRTLQILNYLIDFELVSYIAWDRQIRRFFSQQALGNPWYTRFTPSGRYPAGFAQQKGTFQILNYLIDFKLVSLPFLAQTDPNVFQVNRLQETRGLWVLHLGEHIPQGLHNRKGRFTSSIIQSTLNL